MTVLPKKLSLQFWIFGTIFSIGALGLSLISGLWLLYEKSFQDRIDADTLSFRTQNAVTRISDIIGNQALILRHVSHSLSLRRYIIKINQKGIRNSPEEMMKSIDRLNRRWKNILVDSPEVNAICGILEARYLRDAMALSNGIIDRIDVTDAFGAIRISSSRPTQFFVGNEIWWQNALLANPHLIHMDPVAEQTESGLFWNLSAPLRNDDGVDAVGIVRIRLRLDLIIDQVALPLRKYGIDLFFQFDNNMFFPSRNDLKRLATSTLSRVPIGEKQVMLDTAHQLLITGVAMESTLPKGVLPLTWKLFAIQKYKPKIVFTNPIVLKTALIWITGLIFWLTISYLIARWITVPLTLLNRGVRQIAEGDFKYRLPRIGISDLGMLSTAFNEMAEELQESKNRIQTFLENQTRSLNALKLYIQNLLSTDHISSVQETLLQILLKMMDADAGILIISDETGAPHTVAAGLSRELAVQLITDFQPPPSGKKIYMAWQDSRLNYVWHFGFQILLCIPIQMQQKPLGTILLLYTKATEHDLKKEDVPDLLSTLTAFHLTLSKLSSEIVHQEKIINTVFSSLDTLIFTVDENLQIQWLNSNAREYLGCDSGECIGDNCYLRFLQKENPCSECPALATFRTGKQQTAKQLWPFGATTQAMQITAYPITNEYGSLTRVLVMVNSIKSSESRYKMFPS